MSNFSDGLLWYNMTPYGIIVLCEHWLEQWFVTTFGAMLLPEPMLIVNWILVTKSVEFESKLTFPFNKMHMKMLSEKYLPFYSGLSLEN